MGKMDTIMRGFKKGREQRARIMLAVILIFTLTFNIQLVMSESRTWSVDDDGPADFSKIQDAINAADPGDTIEVSAGVYNESIVVDKTLSIIGEGSRVAIIDGMGSESTVIIDSDNSYLSGFTIRNAWGECVAVNHGHSNNEVSRNFITWTGMGIVLRWASNNNIIRWNNITWAGNGIYLVGSDNNIILENMLNYTGNSIGVHSDSTGNFVVGNKVLNSWSAGIYFYDNNNSAINNTMINCEPGIQIDTRYASTHSNKNVLRNNIFIHSGLDIGGWDLSNYFHDIDTSNIMNGKPVYYLVNQTNLLIDPIHFPDFGYLGLVNSVNITIKDLTISNNFTCLFLAYVTDSTVENVTAIAYGTSSRGILLVASERNMLRRNVLKGNIAGVTIRSSNNIIRESTITGNFSGIFIQGNKNKIIENIIKESEYGLYIYGGNNQIFENIISNNINGIYFETQSQNIIYHNDFINNMNQVEAMFDRNNIWNNEYPSGGNYWSEYVDVDELSGSYQNETGADGIWDNPYFINEYNSDKYPLVNPWSPRSKKVVITGYFYYLDNENNHQPVDRVLVELYDDDSGSDELIDSSYTTSDGYFVLESINNIDEEPGESGTRDVYVKVYANNWAGNIINDDTWEFQTSTVWDIPHGSHDWGSMPVPEDDLNAAFFILTVITKGYDYANKYASFPQVKVIWHQGYDHRTGYQPLADTIHLSGTTNNPDQWDEGIILHEYGHFVADKLDIDAWYYFGGEHEWSGIYTPELAWSEGWAHFFSSAVRKHPVYRNTYAYDIWAEFNVETGIESNDLGNEKTANALGGSCEASVAGILWDIYDGYTMRDDQNNDGIGDNLDNHEDDIWDVVINYSTGGLLPHNVYTIFDFWNGWFTLDHKNNQEMWDIYYEHGEIMPLLVEPPSDLGVIPVGSDAALDFVTNFTYATQSMAIILVNYSDPGLTYIGYTAKMAGVDASDQFDLYVGTHAYTSFTAEMDGADALNQFVVEDNVGSLMLNCSSLQPANGTLRVELAFQAEAAGNHTLDWRYIYDAFREPPRAHAMMDGSGSTTVEAIHGMMVPFYAGWNLIGVPSNLVDPSVEGVFSGNLSRVEYVYGFDNEAKDYVYWINGLPPEYQTLELMEPGKGYWAYVNENFTQVIQYHPS